jgi:hypothetical protein
MGCFKNLGLMLVYELNVRLKFPNLLGLRSLILTQHENPIEFCLKTPCYVERRRGTLILKFFIFYEPSRQGTILD